MEKLTEEEMLRMLKENPDELIKHLEKCPINLEELGQEMDIARKFVKEGYKINDEDILAVEFVFWFAYFVERSIQDFIVEPEVGMGGRRETIQSLTDRLSFGDKISVISELYKEDLKKGDLLSLLWKINEIRNHVAHGRFDKLKYKECELSDIRGQLKIIVDFKDALFGVKND
ncbi:hypothetical protein A3K33_00930 [Candidatus Azambacteria bacterium RIFOXYC1_FULL_41_20]|nr:MAG: hypothetical protein UV39_C0033G0007 [Candidatus Azambacteria bacterium GW2011_GWA2_42_62]OGD41109.1 MAG: hypothetical protein A3K28_00940 [Candidatus Azambacteria bacterium RIFOXYB1_FULL_40_33]OGD41878.1 MAG: hypothetical protein A3I82_00030 [Candidatus Azambacteria bacterium RIFCSPLOWO2_02_FULL_42_10]OGD42483.1 MAG: hypothetical protein A2193_00950 [Candidatus Azambacteria bacterium RIFOXYA1_FULL_42_37]OGD43593.1 MAG: hypothetical protein A3K33_00930 [Candidatus Azambacteria bacterium